MKKTSQAKRDVPKVAKRGPKDLKPAEGKTKNVRGGLTNPDPEEEDPMIP